MIKLRDFDKREEKFISYVINSTFFEDNILSEENLIFNQDEIYKIISCSHIQIIISDNIRIGISLKIKKKEFVFVLPFSYVNNLINITSLKKLKIIQINLNKSNILNYNNMMIDQNNLKNINLKNSNKYLFNHKYSFFIVL